MCEDGRPLQEVWMVLEFCNRGTLSDAIQRGWLLSGMPPISLKPLRLWMKHAHPLAAVVV